MSLPQTSLDMAKARHRRSTTRSDFTSEAQIEFLKRVSDAARGARKRHGFAALLDGYEDRKKVEEKSWHASFASTNMVMQEY